MAKKTAMKPQKENVELYWKDKLEEFEEEHPELARVVHELRATRLKLEIEHDLLTDLRRDFKKAKVQGDEEKMNKIMKSLSTIESVCSSLEQMEKDCFLEIWPTLCPKGCSGPGPLFDIEDMKEYLYIEELVA